MATQLGTRCRATRRRYHPSAAEGLSRSVRQRPDEGYQRDRLRREAVFLKALHGRGVQVPSYVGYEPESDIEGLLRVMHAVAARHEFVLAPIQAYCGFDTGTRLQRFDWAR